MIYCEFSRAADTADTCVHSSLNYEYYTEAYNHSVVILLPSASHMLFWMFLCVQG